MAAVLASSVHFPRNHGRLLLVTLGAPAIAFVVFLLATELYPTQMSQLSRRVIGNKDTVRLEGVFFSVKDGYSRLKYRLFGASDSPFDDAKSADTHASVRAAAVAGISDDVAASPTDAVAASPALALPQTRPLRTDLAPGEGVWTTEGLPHASPNDVLMAKTFVRPDPSRDAVVGILLLDKRRIRLHLVGGTRDPGGDRGVKGPGTIAESDRQSLLVAWNGGFQGPHGNNSMYGPDYRGVPSYYRPLRNGLASVAVYQDGTIAMGVWGRELNMTPEIVAVRQNLVPLVDGCEINKRTSEGNDTWGYVNVDDTATFITSRSAIGLTANGDLLVAAGSNVSAASLARALQAAGACEAMQLDINVSYVVTSLFFPQPDGSLKAEKFMPRTMSLDPAKFLKTQERDFMYVTLDDSDFHR
jgi:hypothetical protein